MPKKSEFSYHKAVAEIEQILSDIENEELDVDILSEKIKRVAFLLKSCKQKLTTTEKEIETILKNLG